MDQFKQLSTFVAVATKGSLSAAAKLENIAAAMIGRRLDALEDRLGVKLLQRTTRKVTLTAEGASFLEDCQRLLTDLNNAEAMVSAGSISAIGHLRMTAPAGFGRKHIAPLIPNFMQQHQGISISLDLSDRMVDLLNESFDCAIRIGDLMDSNLVAVRLTSSQRVIVAAPDYLRRHGTPQTIADLDHHNCLLLSSTNGMPTQRGWTLKDMATGLPHSYKLKGNIECTDGTVLHDWVLAGHGLAWRSWWEVGEAVKNKQLVTVLDEFAAPPIGVYVMFPARKHLPLRVRVWIDFLKDQFSHAQFLREL